MPGLIEEATELFLFIVSVGVVVVTLTIVIVGYQLSKTLQEARTLIAIATTEARALSDGRKELTHQARFAAKWLRIMGAHFIGRRRITY
ncbi:MAG TPA: hypothetical protein VFY28_00480 [Candidatus Paceibacterota bacterium]|nr:hypothetical protein [Candidatus Paceibacterota bacterium]